MRLLFVHHTVSPATHALHDAATEGLDMVREISVVVRPALGATVTDVLDADAYLLGSPVNLGYISGALKHFFDTVYYPCLDATRGRPFAAYLHAGGDATGALRAIEAIAARGLGWREVQRPVVVSDSGPEARRSVMELAAALAAGLTLT